MKESTASPDPSSPPVATVPAFMQKATADAKAQDAAAAAQRAAAKELSQQELDEAGFRSATIEKATSRLLELAGYLGKIDDALGAHLPNFIGLNPIGSLLDTYIALEGSVDEVEDALKLIKARVSTVREVSFPARLDAEATSNVTSSESGSRVTRTERLFASIRAGFQEQGQAWLVANGLEALIKPTVNSSSLSSAVKEIRGRGDDVPEEIFNVSMRDGVSITKGKKKT